MPPEMRSQAKPTGHIRAVPSRPAPLAQIQALELQQPNEPIYHWYRVVLLNKIVKMRRKQRPLLTINSFNVSHFPVLRSLPDLLLLSTHHHQTGFDHSTFSYPLV